MKQALLISLRLHLLWFVETIGPRGRALGPLGIRRLVILLILGPLYLLLQVCHWLGLLLDELFFRRYRSVPIKEPLFVTGVPCSGSSLVQRVLANDTGQFTTLRRWEVVLAPSIFQKRLIRALSRIDRALGAPLHCLADCLLGRLVGPRARLNADGLYAPEEDYLCLLPAAGCFVMMAGFPASPSLWELGRFPEIPDPHRERLIRFYRACLQKHLYDARRGVRLLSKNTAFASWIPDLRLAFPDARYLVCIREPREVLPLKLSSLRPGLDFCGTLPAADTIALELQTVLTHAYRILLEEKDSFLVDHLAVIDHRELQTDLQAALRRRLRQLTIQITDQLDQAIDRADPQALPQLDPDLVIPLSAKSGPREFGSMVTQIYEKILDHPPQSRG